VEGPFDASYTGAVEIEIVGDTSEWLDPYGEDALS
jgi:hypothetical protein